MRKFTQEEIKQLEKTIYSKNELWVLAFKTFNHHRLLIEKKYINALPMGCKVCWGKVLKFIKDENNTQRNSDT